jgi:hypothetical protein
VAGVVAAMHRIAQEEPVTEAVTRRTGSRARRLALKPDPGQLAPESGRA